MALDSLPGAIEAVIELHAARLAQSQTFCNADAAGRSDSLGIELDHVS
jgi:hypothetical protein